MEKGIKSSIDHKRYTSTTLDEFRESMKAVLVKNKTVVEYAILELYEQGLLLHRKYKYLGLAFKSFGIGMLIAILISLILQFSL